MPISASRYLWCLSILVAILVAYRVDIANAQTHLDQPAPKPTAVVKSLLDTVDRLIAAGRIPDAMQSVEQALTAATEQQDAAGEAIALERRAGIREGEQQNEAALEDWQKAASAWERSGEGTLQAGALANAGMLLLNTEPTRAHELLNQALLLCRSETRRSHAAALELSRIGQSLLIAATSGGINESRLDAATFLQAALDRLPSNSLDTAICLLALCRTHTIIGERKAVAPLLQKTLTMLHRFAPGSENEGICLNAIGNMYIDEADMEAAANCFHHALAIMERKFPYSPFLANVYDSLGVVALIQGRPHVARQCFLRCGMIYKVLRSDPGIAVSLDHLGVLAHRQGDLRTARTQLQAAYDLRAKFGPISLQRAETAFHLGELERDCGHPVAAQRWLEQAQTLQQRLSPGTLPMADTLQTLGELCLARHNPQKAIRSLRAAIEIVEQLRAHIASTDIRLLLLSRHAGKYNDLVRAELAVGDIPAAYAALERGRARSFADSLSERRLSLPTDAPLPLLNRQQALDIQRDAAFRQRSRLDPTSQADRQQLTDNTQALKALALQQRQLEEAIRHASSRYAAIAYPQPPDLGEVQRTLAPDTLLMEYAVDTDQTYLFAVTRSTVHLHRVPIQAIELRRRVNNFRIAVSTPGGNFLKEAGALYERLIRPAQSEMRAARRLLLCPDGPLHTLPFAALRDQKTGHYLIEATPLQVVVSMSVYRQLQRDRSRNRKTPDRVLALGDPNYDMASRPARTSARRFQQMGAQLTPLPLTRQQLQTIGALYHDRATLLTGRQATPHAVLQQAGKFRILHFACHGLLDDSNPLASALALSPANTRDDGMLRAYTVMQNLHLQADLVVLSACQTGLGTETKNEGIVGMTRAFQYAGARSVLVSLWDIADTSSTELMKVFYVQIRSGRAKDEALRAAQLALIHSREFGHPFHWAAFILSGRWELEARLTQADNSDHVSPRRTVHGPSTGIGRSK